MNVLKKYKKILIPVLLLLILAAISIPVAVKYTSDKEVAQLEENKTENTQQAEAGSTSGENAERTGAADVAASGSGQAESGPSAQSTQANGSDSSAQNSGGSASSGANTGSSGQGGSASSGANTGSSGQGGSAQSGTPAHQHQWQAHKVWVKNIVTVVDEPEQVIYGAQLYTKHSDGKWYSDGETYWFENGFTKDDLKALLKDKIKNEGYIGNYVNRQKTVPAKTHTEDHGSYQTDYYYCSCGAKKYN